jgi:hypothetical protein
LRSFCGAGRSLEERLIFMNTQYNLLFDIILVYKKKFS